MEIALKIVAYLALVLVGISILIGPFQIEKTNRPNTAAGYIGSLVGSAITIFLVGRVLGWW